MKHKSVISYYSLAAAIIATAPATAAVRVGNLSRSYADSYNQVNNQRVGMVTNNFASQNDLSANVSASVSTAVDKTGAVVDLPVRVANADLAKRIGLGETVGRVNLGTLETCARLYPDGDFAWDTPTVGMGSGGAQTCIAVVEMRAVNADGRGGDAVVARANLAAGDSVKCNISDFPEYSYTDAATKIEFPADREPTMDDVVAQMNLEQKQNAGIKIAAGAVVGAFGGNMVGKGERGSDSLLGTGKDKMTASAIGALSGAALMAGNSYAGKVGGDVILSTGVNAAAGGLVGNIMASGNSVLRIEDCEISGVKTTCLWGSVVQTKDFILDKSKEIAFYNIDGGDSVKCKVLGDAYVKCKNVALRDIKLTADKSKSLNQWKSNNNFGDIIQNSSLHFNFDKATATVSAGAPADGNNNIYVQIDSAREEDGMPIRAMVAHIKDKAMGYTADDWSKENKNGLKLYGRNSNGDAYAIDTEKFSIDNFSPRTIDAEDGGIVDFSNKARLKSTLTGAGVGGAMGAFVGYQGAQSDIDERWVSAQREYKDSLTRVYCATGRRYLGAYNEMVDVPPLGEFRQ